MPSQPGLGQKWDILLAHAGPDIRYAEALYEHLTQEDVGHRPVRVFLDSKALKLGDDWDLEIARAQRNSKVTVVLISDSTEQAYYQREEVAAAVAMAREDGTKHRVVPLVIAGASNRPTAPYGLRLKHGLAVYKIGDLSWAALRLRELIYDIDEIPDPLLARRTAALECDVEEPLSLSAMARGTRTGAQAIHAFTSLLEEAVASGFRTLDVIKDHRERARLKELLRQLMQIERAQAPLPWLLRRYVDRVRTGPKQFDNWSQVTRTLARLTPVVAKVVELLSSCDGNFIVVKHDSYKQLLFGLQDRMSVYHQIGRLEKPATSEDLASLEDIAGHYEQMIADLKSAQAAIVSYLSE